MKKITQLAIAASVLALVVGGVLMFFLIRDSEPFKAERGDFVGSWAGPGGARLTVREDGSVTGEKVPSSFDGSASAVTGTASGSGTWSMGKRHTSLANQMIKVTLRTGPAEKTTLEVGAYGQGAKKGLYLSVSADTEEKFVLKKAP
ncbi:hypothetical protein [Streptomyces rimosus]|uniref:hypothetical protein n=1 Tax=Streptomyces rimosus TaxID=1927 RepID=UPI0004C8FB67|nr:hypothetical protein [Streptomyces rimosus]